MKSLLLSINVLILGSCFCIDNISATDQNKSDVTGLLDTLQIDTISNAKLYRRTPNGFQSIQNLADLQPGDQQALHDGNFICVDNFRLVQTRGNTASLVAALFLGTQNRALITGLHEVAMHS